MPSRAAFAAVAALAISLVASACSGMMSAQSSGSAGPVTERVMPIQHAPASTPARLVTYCSSGPRCDDFATPSGNIRCFGWAGLGGTVECTMLSPLVPKPATTCELDVVGLALSVGHPAKPDCRGDPTPAGLDKHIPPLAYGSAWEGFEIRCVSRTVGLTCSDGRGHGFFLSRERWSVR